MALKLGLFSAVGVMIAAGAIGAAPQQAVFISPMGEPFRAPMDQPYPSAAWFARADANHDGVLTRGEFVADAVRFFDALDPEQLGYLDDEAITRYETDVAPEIKSSLGGDGAGVFDVLPTGRRSIDGDRDGGASGGIGALRGANHDQPTGTINSATRKDERPQGAGIYGVLPFPEPVTSARAYYGQRITRQVFADAASKRFDMLTGAATMLKASDLPTTPIQRMMGARRAKP